VLQDLDGIWAHLNTSPDFSEDWRLFEEDHLKTSTP
jgi:hypothetical protein